MVRSIVEGAAKPSEIDLDGLLATLPRSAQQSCESTNLDGLKAILVMDSGVQRKIVVTELTQKGLDISFVSSPLEALELAFRLKPDLVLCSQEFPNITGGEFARYSAALENSRVQSSLS